MYTDEPVPKKDVASGQNFSRFNLLTKITAFPLLGYPTAHNSQGSLPGAMGFRRSFCSKVYQQGRNLRRDQPDYN
jgi:hypothetical protein